MNALRILVPMEVAARMESISLSATVRPAMEVDAARRTSMSVVLILVSMAASVGMVSTRTLANVCRATREETVKSTSTIASITRVATEGPALIWSMAISAYAAFRSRAEIASPRWIPVCRTAAGTVPNVLLVRITWISPAAVPWAIRADYAMKISTSAPCLRRAAMVLPAETRTDPTSVCAPRAMRAGIVP